MRTDLQMPLRKESLVIYSAGILVLASVVVAAVQLALRTRQLNSPPIISVPARPPTMLPAPAWNPFGVADPVGEPPPTTLPIKLRGIIFAGNTDLSAGYVSAGEEAPRPVRIGEDAGGGIVAEIRRDRLILSVDGRLESLAFPQYGVLVQDLSPTSRPRRLSPVSRSRSSMLGVPPSRGQEMTISDTAGGLLIGASPLRGLRTGDVVIEIEGTPVRDRAALDAAMAVTQNSRDMHVKVQRDGVVRNLIVPR